MKEDRFFQFPLCTLAFGTQIEERFEHLISYSVVKAGGQAWEGLDEDEQEEQENALSRGKLPHGFQAWNPEHLRVMYGAQILNVVLGSINSTLDRFKALDSFVNGRELTYGKDPTVRMKTEFVWRAKSGLFSYRDFSVLCAVYSVIGTNPRPVLINRKMIQCRALGYKTPVMMKKCGKGNKVQALTTKQIRTTLDQLQSLGYFSRVNPAPKSRRAYFSNRLTEAEMINALAEKEFHRKKLAVTRPHSANQVQELVQAKMRLLSGPLLSGHDSEPEARQGPLRATRGPDKGQTGAT